MLSSFNFVHVQSDSGAFVVPARSPYDRQMLREHLRIGVGESSVLTLGEHGARWIVTGDAAAGARCTTCAHFLGRLSCSRQAETAAATCIDCALLPHGQGARRRRPA